MIWDDNNDDDWTQRVKNTFFMGSPQSNEERDLLWKVVSILAVGGLAIWGLAVLLNPVFHFW